MENLADSFEEVLVFGEGEEIDEGIFKYWHDEFPDCGFGLEIIIAVII